jgi:uncharacterized RDD family membrane protein YckC
LPLPLPAPPLKRRLAAMLYESMLLFGVVAVAGALFAVLLEQRHALYLRQPLQYLLFVVLALYFIWFWTQGGQTLAMQTWRIRLVTASGDPVGYARALLRYLLAWAWFLPGMAIAWAIGAHGPLLVLIPAANLVLWASTAYLDPERQFLHDRIAGTRLVNIVSSPTAEKSGKYR